MRVGYYGDDACVVEDGEEMKINIISNLGEDGKLEKIRNFNCVVSWFLRIALEKKGVDVRFVKDRDLLLDSLPKADHVIVTSSKAMSRIAGRHNVRGVKKNIRKATKGKVTLYLDADYPQWDKHFDYIFTVIKPITENPKYVYGGWGADPDYCYPEQKEKTVFLDSFNLKKPRGRQGIYNIYEKVLPAMKLKLYRPRPNYFKGKRLYWPEFQKILRKCHYYCCTQLGESGLSRIEASTCGARLIVPRMLYKPRTMKSLEHVLWGTAEELKKALTTDTNPQAIRKKALKHSWDKVATRILNRLNK